MSARNVEIVIRISPGAALILGLSAAAVAMSLRRPAERAPAVALATMSPAPELEERSSGMAPGRPHGEEEAVITPLNVRDPAALVFPPASEPPPRAEAPPPASEPAADWR